MYRTFGSALLFEVLLKSGRSALLFCRLCIQAEKFEKIRTKRKAKTEMTFGCLMNAMRKHHEWPTIALENCFENDSDNSSDNHSCCHAVR
ncbi:MAG: hypothetical protein C0507_12260 [Cyanobacteria bacterium PR.3.49]|nr:hypothetical protein [Cyanobacteria bacterium PR.3.49]